MTLRVKYTYGTPTKFPELFRLQQASPELPLRPLDGSHMFFYGYFICQPLITAYSVNTSFIDGSYSMWVFRNKTLSDTDFVPFMNNACTFRTRGNDIRLGIGLESWTFCGSRCRSRRYRGYHDDRHYSH